MLLLANGHARDLQWKSIKRARYIRRRRDATRIKLGLCIKISLIPGMTRRVYVVQEGKETVPVCTTLRSLINVTQTPSIASCGERERCSDWFHRVISLTRRGRPRRLHCVIRRALRCGAEKLVFSLAGTKPFKRALCQKMGISDCFQETLLEEIKARVTKTEMRSMYEATKSKGLSSKRLETCKISGKVL